MSIVIALVGLSLPLAGFNEALANGGRKPVVKEKDAKKKAAPAKRAATKRSYSVRGNPDVTRRVATALIVEKLPELAQMINLSAPAGEDGESVPVAVIERPVAPAITTTVSVPDGYQDSELDESEDTDRISKDDLESLDDLPDDINEFYKEFTGYMATLNGEHGTTDNGVDKMMMMESIVDWLGTRYHFGGMGRGGIDCSAFTGTVYRALNFKLPRTAAAQWDFGTAVPLEELQFGDLVFFHTRAAVYVSHVGIYLGNNMFAHASSRNGVTVSSLDADYYAKHLIGARRFDLTATDMAAGSGETGTN
jgi:lipoprotein Spr